MQDAPVAGDSEEAAAEEDAEAGAGLDLSLTKKKKKRKPKARTDEEFGAMVEDTEGAAVDGAPSINPYEGQRCCALRLIRVLTQRACIKEGCYYTQVCQHSISKDG